MKTLFFFFLSSICLLCAKEELSVEGGRLLVHIDKEALFSPQDFAEKAQGTFLEVEERNPFLSLEKVYLSTPFLVLSTHLDAYTLRTLSRRYGYRLLSLKTKELDKAIIETKELRESIPTSVEDLPTLSLKEEEQLYSLLQRIDNILTRENIPFFATRSLLLGAVLQQRILPWNTDLALAIFACDEKKLNAVQEALYEQGIGFFYYKEKEFYKLYDLEGTLIEREDGTFCPFRYPFIDLFTFSLEKTKECEDTYVHSSRDYHTFHPMERLRYQDLLPLSRIPLGPITIPIPSHPIPYLNALFGQDSFPELWRRYAKEAVWDFKREKSIPNGAAFVNITK